MGRLDGLPEEIHAVMPSDLPPFGCQDADPGSYAVRIGADAPETHFEPPLGGSRMHQEIQGFTPIRDQKIECPVIVRIENEQTVGFRASIHSTGARYILEAENAFFFRHIPEESVGSIPFQEGPVDHKQIEITVQVEVAEFGSPGPVGVLNPVLGGNILQRSGCGSQEKGVGQDATPTHCIVGDEQVRPAVPGHIAERQAHAFAFVTKAPLCRYIGKHAVSVVAEQTIRSEIVGQIQVGPTVEVHIPRQAHPRPILQIKSCFLADVRECPISIIAIEGIASCPRAYIEVQIPIQVEIPPGGSARFGLVCRRIRSVQARLIGHVGERAVSVVPEQDFRSDVRQEEVRIPIPIVIAPRGS